MVEWQEPEAAVRGSVVVVAGRGESEAVYRRLSRRMAFDGYRATIVADGDPQQTERAAAEAIDEAEDGLPVVVIGSDAGAAAAVRLSTRRGVTGIVVAGLLADGGAFLQGDELDARSACPVHRAVLDDAARPGALRRAAPAVTQGELAVVPVPVLAVHGEDDPVSSVDGALRLLDAADDAEVVVIAGGRHDILNDTSHRTVAAAVVQFLERLRAPGAASILRRIARPAPEPAGA